MTSSTCRILAAYLAAGAPLCAAHAQDKAPVSQDAAPGAQPVDPTVPREQGEANPAAGWTVNVEPALWWVSPSGRARLPASGATRSDRIKLSALNLDNPRFTPAGAVSINADKWRFSFNGASYNEDRQATADSSFQFGDVAASAGDRLHTSFDYSTFEVTGGYRVLAYDFKARSENPENAADLVLNVYAIAGVRLTDVKFGIERGSSSSSTDQFFVEPIVGARSELQIRRDFDMNLQLSGGGYGDSDRSAVSFDIAVSFGWRPVENVGVEIGWRQILYTMKDGSGTGEFSYDGAMAGLFASILIRF